MNKLFLVIALLFFISLAADTNFTIMSYNALNFLGTSSYRAQYFKEIIEYSDPDLIVMQEIVDESGANLLLNYFNQINNEYASSVYVNGPDTNNMLYFKSAVFSLVSQAEISTDLRDISEYVLMVNDQEFRIYSCHLKSSDGSTNEQLRYQEILQLRAHIEALPTGTEYIIAGDMNFYDDDEPAYENLTITTPLISEDICTEVGNWHNNSNFAHIHTQSTRLTAFGYGASGGMDDKFDFLFASIGMNDNAGIDYIPNSFESFGNDGNHFNQSINSGTNSAVPSNIADALFEASDHLPVIADFVAFGSGGQMLSDPIISEYIEGSSYNKAIEIFNPNNEQIYLAAYSLQKDENGNENWVNTYNLSGILAAGEVFVLANSQADPQILAVADDTDDGVINFNGDDQVRLIKNSIEIDRIGIPGEVTFGADVTYVRKPEFITPQSGPQDPRNNGEWDIFPEDTFSYLGSHTAIVPAITVISPDGGENWQRGSTQNIMWNSSDISDFVKIELIDNVSDSTYMLIDSTDNDGEWIWQIPNDLEISLSYKIKISDLSSAIYDESNSYFQIYGKYLISEIQTTPDGEEGDSPLIGQIVSTYGVVTAVATNRYFIQNGTGAWNGIYVYDSNITSLGDSLHITGLVEEYYNKTEIINISEFSVEASNAEVPAAEIISCQQANHEKYEGVLVQVLEAVCTNTSLGYGEWLVNDGNSDLIIDDLMYAFPPVLNEYYNLTGIIDYSFSNYKLEPRFAGDIEIYSAQPDPPQNVNIEILQDTDQIKLTWLNEGYIYKIYSNSNPNISFPDDSWNFETSITDSGEIILAENGSRKFYIITAE